MRDAPLSEPLPSKDLLSRCAAAWGLAKIAFVRKMENIVFSCERGGETVYLRLTSPLRRRRPEIEAEIAWMEHLTKWGVRVPRPIPDREGNRVVAFTEGDRHFEAVVFTAMEGEHPSEAVVVDPKFLKTLGALIAKMHLASCAWEHLGREEWFEERGLRHAMTAAAVSKESALRERLDAAVAWMRQLPRTRENYGLIHADLGGLNMFVDGDSAIGIIDFDDSCFHWFVFDLAIVICSMAGRMNHTRTREEERRWLADLVEGYRSVRRLSQEEIAWIPKLIEFALLRLFFWIEWHQTLQTFHEDAVERVAGLKQLILGRLSPFQSSD